VTTSNLYSIVAKVMDVSPSQVNDQSGPENIERWDSFNGYVLLDDIEMEFGVRFSIDEALDIKNVGDIKRILEKHGVIF
jgi:acyl carrier protein